MYYRRGLSGLGLHRRGWELQQWPSTHWKGWEPAIQSTMLNASLPTWCWRVVRFLETFCYPSSVEGWRRCFLMPLTDDSGTRKTDAFPRRKKRYASKPSLWIFTSGLLPGGFAYSRRESSLLGKSFLEIFWDLPKGMSLKWFQVESM